MYDLRGVIDRGEVRSMLELLKLLMSYKQWFFVSILMSPYTVFVVIKLFKWEVKVVIALECVIL